MERVFVLVTCIKLQYEAVLSVQCQFTCRLKWIPNGKTFQTKRV